jgi:hypothetical protein
MMSKPDIWVTGEVNPDYPEWAEKRIVELEATIAELKKDRDIALAEAYRCGYEAAKMEDKEDE